MLEKHLTVAEVAELLSLHPETVRQLIRSGSLPATRIGTRGRWLVPEARVRVALFQNEERLRRRRVSWSTRRRWGVA